MKKDLALKPTDFTSSFLSCQKDLQTILRRLFVQSQPYSNQLKKLFVINMKDCLDNDSQIYNNAIKDMSLAKLREYGYIRLQPKLIIHQHEEVKTYMLITFDNFKTNYTNPQFRDCVVTIDILSHPDYWDIGKFRVRPIKICGYIDAILNNTKLSGIGTFQFLSCNELVLDENLAGYTLMFKAVHGTDDVLPSEHEWLVRE